MPSVKISAAEIKKRRSAIYGDGRGARTEAANAAGMNTVQQWLQFEYGQRTNSDVDTLYRIARALRCRMEDLLEIAD